MALNSFTPMQAPPILSGLSLPFITVTTYSDTATVTAAEVLGGLLIETKNGAATLTLPTAALLNAALQAPVAGRSFEFSVRNTGNNTTTVGVGTGGTSFTGNTLTIATVSTRYFLLRVTGVANASDPSSSDTYTLYSMGVGLH